jgi:hypothetical protein
VYVDLYTTNFYTGTSIIFGSDISHRSPSKILDSAA